MVPSRAPVPLIEVISVPLAMPCSQRSRFVLFALAVLLAASLSRLAAAETLSDGTKVEHWIMPNGLRVVTRHVPDAHISVVTLCYRLGTLEDPEKQEGLADLCGQVAITARAGDVPQRQLAEIDQVRPSGWSVHAWLQGRKIDCVDRDVTIAPGGHPELRLVLPR